MTVTPYEVEGEVDYAKTVKEFGAQFIDDKITKMFPHPLIKKKYFYAHRNFDRILEDNQKGKKFSIVSGRGVSENMHLGHLICYKFIADMQKEFGCHVFIPFSDDEKFLYKQNLAFEEVQKFDYENALDIIALGFDMKNTELIFDTLNMPQGLYNLAIKSAKHITTSTVKCALGFDDSKNIGSNFYPAMQTAHILYPTVKYGYPVVVPVGLDQDVLIKLSRDVAEKMKLRKPADIISRFVRGLSGNPKMSASDPQNTLYTTDTEEQIKKKLSNAFTGGAPTVAEQKEKGGNPDVCSAYEYLGLFFYDDPSELHEKCKSGRVTCGECKKELAEKMCKFLKAHQAQREKARKTLDKLLQK